MPRRSSSRTWGKSKNYWASQPTILLAKDERNDQAIRQERRHVSTEQGGPTCTVRDAPIELSSGPTLEINRYGLDHGLTKFRRIRHHTHRYWPSNEDETFIYCRKTLDARQFATLYLKEIKRLHGIPRNIITDRGSLFTSELWKHTTEKLGIERRLSTAFHPQTDGQTERTNGILEQYLRAYINYQQDNWNELLPLAEFAYNNGYQETIKMTPFYANYGINPEHQFITHMMTEKITSANGMKDLHDTLRVEMATAQPQHQENWNRHRKPDPNLKSGDMVWFLPRNVHTTRPSKKLDYKKIGPFKILAKIGTSAYKLAFPP